MLQPGMLHSVLPAAVRGNVRIVHDTPDEFTRLRASMSGQPLHADVYTRLLIGDNVWMTDAEFECRTNSSPVRRMTGDVLIAGLGIGLVLRPLLANGAVTSITVIENNPDVITLVKPTYECQKLLVVEADCRTWKVPRQQYNCIYLDIWADVPNSDTREDIKLLKRRYRRGLKSGGWIEAWCESYARRR